jgi:hypothetical protein
MVIEMLFLLAWERCIGVSSSKPVKKIGGDPQQRMTYSIESFLHQQKIFSMNLASKT